MKILVIAGSSGGHIFPALGFLDALKHRHDNIDTLLVLSSQQGFWHEYLPGKNIKNQVSNCRSTEDAVAKDAASSKKIFDCKVNYISISPVRLSFSFKNFIAILKLFKGALESLIILLTYRPDVVVAFGTLVCIPMVVFAHAFGIKTVIHEQNVIPGKANRFLAKFTDKIAISFDETKDYFKDYESKIILTGNPIRKELERIDKNKALDFFGFSKDKFTILIMGGSQGSHSINLGFLKAIAAISDKFKIQIIHLAGALDCGLLEQSYRDLNTDIKLFRFLDSMQYAYSASDLVVSRGGASTITEFIFFKLPAIIIPYPFAYKHQAANAKVLEKAGSAIIIKDNELDADILKESIEELLNNPDRIKTMRACYDSFLWFNINDLLIDEALSLN